MFEKPGKMSWRYTNNGNRVVSDGKLIKIYEKENKQMYEQPLDKSQYPAALSFLAGDGKLKQNFKFTKRDSKQMGFESGYVLAGDPLKPHPRTSDHVLRRRRDLPGASRAHDRRAGQPQPLRLREPGSEHQDRAGEFAFTPPPGTQVIRP